MIHLWAARAWVSRRRADRLPLFFLRPLIKRFNGHFKLTNHDDRKHLQQLLLSTTEQLASPSPDAGPDTSADSRAYPVTDAFT
jgi:hypothetical protein